MLEIDLAAEVDNQSSIRRDFLPVIPKWVITPGRRDFKSYILVSRIETRLRMFPQKSVALRVLKLQPATISAKLDGHGFKFHLAQGDHCSIEPAREVLRLQNL